MRDVAFHEKEDCENSNQMTFFATGLTFRRNGVFLILLLDQVRRVVCSVEGRGGAPSANKARLADLTRLLLSFSAIIECFR